MGPTLHSRRALVTTSESNAYSVTFNRRRHNRRRLARLPRGDDAREPHGGRHPSITASDARAPPRPEARLAAAFREDTVPLYRYRCRSPLRRVSLVAYWLSS
jgi:hypothetical protein